MLAFFILSFFLFSAGSIALNPKYSFLLYDIDSFSGENFSISEILEKRLARDKVRVSYLLDFISGSVVVFPVPGSFVTILNAGLSKQKIPLMIDTGSSITWWQCECGSSCYPQIDPIYNSSEPQSTFQLIPCYKNLQCLQYPAISCGEFGECQYSVNYADGDSSGGPMAQELVYIGDEIKTEIIFGCGRFQSGTHFSPYAAGIMGLSLGPYSLVRQLNVSIFSLCLPPINGKWVSTLEFNAEHVAAKDETTFFIPPPTSLEDPYAGEFHYVAIKEVWVTDVRIDVPPSYWGFESGGKGSMIDLGTTLTYMPTYAYRSLRDNFTAQVQNHVPGLTLLEEGFHGLETCFRVKDPETIIWEHLPLPFFKINFMDSSSYHALEVEQMLLSVSDDILCLAFQDNGESGGTILGNTLFQRTRLTYDLSEQTISFEPYSCD